MSKSTQPEALRLAEKLRDMSTMFKTPSHEKGVCNGAIQELNRLYHLEQLRCKHIEEWQASWEREHALKTELLDALFRAASALESVSYNDPSISSALTKARAAIAKALEG